ncbi:MULTISPECIES: polysaccharide pyruvyl transferase family protein [unclassified Caballeronia]|uniref:polysaccharide pyruvyl transferase family protein n=1 Tax=unclassified Caballeronia TaxID=2646786 RepID=UPI0020293BA7|nr:MULTISPECIES: polysaccharide pyruvyl transferase family protein [unclassified Caballeronia]MDR5767011.1 polysaccharide pyruvyl transferase family protein [Caballeronia sp. LZ028]
MGSNRRIIVFGAFDRHNFGDMLFAHVVAALLAERRPNVEPIFAGCARRELRAHGGHGVAALSQLAARWRDEPVVLIHAGGELLTCDAWEAAVMLKHPDEAQACIPRYESRAADRNAWARAELGMDALAPYVIGREMFPRAASISFDAIGGATLDARDAAFRAEVLAKLRSADDISVRDTHTQAFLKRAGIDARLVPDPASMVAELFDARIRTRAGACRAFPHAYLAVQFSADFGDDATLAQIAHQLDLIGASTGLGIALFRAGAAPWHDDIAVYERMAARMRHPSVTIFDSLDVWDICALIAKSDGYAGSSLHGRIVAMAYGLPRVNIAHTDAAKQRAYASTWEIAGAPGVVSIAELHPAMHEARAMDRAALRETASALAKAHRAGFERVARSALGP